MDREKQIKEMAELIYKETDLYNVDTAYDISTVLHDAGYRRQSDTAREIFKELSKFIVTKVIHNGTINYDITDTYIELQKKYGIEGINSREKLKRSRNKLRGAFKKYKGVGE